MREERRHGADMLLAVLRAQRGRTTMTAGLAALHAALAPLVAAFFAEQLGQGKGAATEASLLKEIAAGIIEGKITHISRQR